MAKTWLRIKNWIKANPLEFGLLLVILALAAFFRLYKIDQYMTFLGDEGRDVIIVRRLLVEGHPPLIGPGTSVGQMYLGPIYYYMMAPALWLANFSPVGPAIQIAILGVITVGFVWFVGREWFGRTAGILSAFLYAISPTVITFSRSSWNPNIMPFFALLSIYAVWRAWRKSQYTWLVILGATYAFVLQSHYFGLFLAPTLFLFWLLSRSPKKYIFYSGILFWTLMSPLFIFDFRHGFQNTRAFEALFASREGVASFGVINILANLVPRFNLLNISLLGAKNNLVGISVSSLIIFVLLFFYFIHTKKSQWLKTFPAYILLICWIGFGIIGFAFYKLPIYDHYFGFLFPAPFLLIGGLLQDIQNRSNVVGKIITYGLFAVLVYFNLITSPLLSTPNRQMQRSQDVARKILSEEQGKPFDLAVLAERNYEDGYRYFLELWGGIVLHADRWDQKTIADDLIVVCELEEAKCDPTHSSKAEVANFGMSKIDDHWEIDGVIIYRLLHSNP